MDSSLLTTKLRIPPPRHDLMPRPRLVDGLARQIRDYKLVLVSTPAGYGKTTLLGQWARASAIPVAWLSLDEGDNDPDRFWRHLVAAWEAAQPGVIESPAGVLLEGLAPDREAVLTAIVNYAGAQPGDLAIVLDDYQAIEEAGVHQTLTFLLDHLPPRLHLVLASRGEPPLPLARYRARNELMELGTDGLRFRDGETERFVNGQVGSSLAEGEIRALQDELEGWIAGLRLVSLTLRGRPAAERAFVGGRHRFIADYLAEDVLSRLPDDSRQFLLQTSILERLCGPLCDAVTGRSDGQEMLETLERASLFLEPLDDDRTWCRYQRPFADYLRAELARWQPDQVADLHRRAAEWQLERDLPEPAFQHAVAAGDAELVLRIAELYLAPKLFGGEVRVVEGWLASIPAGWYDDHPMLGLIQAMFQVITGSFDASLRSLDGVEQRLGGIAQEDTRAKLAKVAMVRCAVACFQNDLHLAETYAGQALNDLRDEDHSYRADIYHALADTYRRNGRWSAARENYLAALDASREPAAHLRVAHILGALADLELEQGRLRDAARFWQRALAAIQERRNWGHLPLPVTGWVYLRMGELLYEQGDLTEAWDYLADGLERAELGGDARSLIAGYLTSCRLRQAAGDVEAAAADLERARAVVERSPFPEWVGRFERCQVLVWLRQDRVREALDWAEGVLRRSDLAGGPASEVTWLAVAHVLIVRGDGPSRQRASDLLARLHQTADAEGRMGVEIEVLALQALTHRQAGDAAAAMTALERALRLAEPEGYLRLFADLGLPMARLLQEARSRSVMPDYVARLLDACGITLAAGGAALPEPLSEREVEVLRLIAAGLSNREIAETLTISPQTVKKHSQNIYGKLGVSQRIGAVAKARSLGLFN